MEKPVIVFTIPDCMGGVTSFYRNIINNAGKGDRYHTRVIFMNDEQDTRKKFDEEIIADEVIVFRHSYFENQRHVFKRLSALLGTEPGCVVTDNALTLNVLKQMGTTKSVVHLIHDYYYIGVALEYRHLIDASIVHSSFFRDVLLAADINTFQHKVRYIPYGVKQADAGFNGHLAMEKLNLVFLGRWEESKGVLLLKEIDDLLRQKNIEVNWTILGSGPKEEELKAQWTGNTRVQFITAKDTEEVYAILSKQDVLVFPSKFEGTPVAIMEAMARGCVPVVTDLPGGTRDLVSEEVGFRCRPGVAEEFVEGVVRLHTDRSLLQTMQKTCLQKTRSAYDIKKAAHNYFSFFESMCLQKPQHAALSRMQLSKLDNALLPNRLVYLIRKMKKSPI